MDTALYLSILNAVIDLSLPTNNGTTIPGKTTISLNGNKGSVILTSMTLIWILYFILQ